MKVAIIDDSMFMRRMVKSAVNDAFPSVDVREYSDGSAAVGGVEEFNPDLILLDLLMPKMNGFEFLSELRSKGVTTDIVVVTADVQTASRKRCCDLGVSGFIDKPITYDKLLVALKELKAV